MRIELFFRQNPFIRFTLYYIAGIIITNCFQGKPTLYILTPVLLLLIILSLIIACKSPIRQRYLQGLIILLLLSGAGGGSYLLRNYHTILPDSVQRYEAVVIGQGVQKSKTVQLDCKIINLVSDTNKTRLNEKIRLYIRVDSSQTLPSIGDLILFSGHPEIIKKRGNPKEFDYARYMFIQGFRYSAFIEKGNYSFGTWTGKLRLSRMAASIQNKIVLLFKKHNIQDEELGVISALIAGDRNLLDDETMKSYVGAGAMHVLAVSGLHVGILYLFLNLLFGNRNQKLYYRLIRLIVIIISLWMYAFITGLSTSVLRAAIMFTLFILGKSFSLRANSYNILAASALIVLLIDPNEIYKVGFQYSYLAVLGILYFQPKLESLVSIKWGIVDRIWQLLTVSIAAQIVTFPLALFFFHQFPVYFWITNIFIIPIVWLIMMVTVIFYCTLPFQFISPLIAFILNNLLKLNNYIVDQISKLPYAVWDNIRFESYHLILFYFTIVSIIVFLSIKKLKYIAFSISALLIIIMCIDLLVIQTHSKKEQLIIYNLNKQQGISIIKGNKHVFISRGIEAEDNQKSLFYLNDYWVSRKINQNLEWIRIEDHQNSRLSCEAFELEVRNKFFKIRMAEKELIYYTKSSLENPFSCQDTNKDQVLLVDRLSGYPNQYILKNSGLSKIVLSASLSPYSRAAWIQFAENNGFPIYDIKKEGSLFLNF